MSFNVEVLLSLVESYRKTESFKTTQIDYNKRSGCPVPGKSTILETFAKVQAGRLIIPKHVRSSTVVTQTRAAEVSDRLSASPQNSLYKHTLGI
jgi:hypothetical protein